LAPGEDTKSPTPDAGRPQPFRFPTGTLLPGPGPGFARVPGTLKVPAGPPVRFQRGESVMIRSRTLVAAAVGLIGLASAAVAEPAQVERAGITRQSPAGTTYSVEVPVLARVQGTAFFRTSVDINNNTSKNGVTAQYQFSYTCVAASCSPAGGFY